MYYCDRCDRSFRTLSAYNQHLNDSASHNVCHDCDIDFQTWDGLRQHWIQSPRHSYCRFCNEHFDDDDELEDHYDSKHIWCRQCNKSFKDGYGLHEHYRQSPVHFYCASCKRLFQSENNLRSHRRSSTHQPRDVKCRGKGCTMTFVSVSAMLLHLESGNCVSGIDRNHVNQKVRELDRNHAITDPSRMIGGPGSQDDPKYYATDCSWNGYAYECYLCHKHRRTLAALNHHLGSPRHQKKFYICPLSTCRVRFSTLSALCQHIESEQCGVHKFRPVKDTMDFVVSGMPVNRLT